MRGDLHATPWVEERKLDWSDNAATSSKRLTDWRVDSLFICVDQRESKQWDCSSFEHKVQHSAYFLLPVHRRFRWEGRECLQFSAAAARGRRKCRSRSRWQRWQLGLTAILVTDGHSDCSEVAEEISRCVYFQRERVDLPHLRTAEVRREISCA